MIDSFRHKGLDELFHAGKSRRINSGLVKRILVRLALLDTAKTLADLAQPGFGFHALHGFEPVRYAISVNGPWRMTFEWHNGVASLVDLEQYH